MWSRPDASNLRTKQAEVGRLTCIPRQSAREVADTVTHAELALAGGPVYTPDAAGRPAGRPRGRSHIDPQALRAHVTALDAAGFQVHVHAIGDRAVREALDAFEAARAVHGDRGRRHHIAHLQVVHPRDVPRFAALGVTANMQALRAAHEPRLDELTIPFLGAERAARQYVFGDLLAAGARWRPAATGA
jgi:predicted amidohydrolase YtcJ